MFVSDRRWPQLGWPARGPCYRLYLPRSVATSTAPVSGITMNVGRLAHSSSGAEWPDLDRERWKVRLALIPTSWSRALSVATTWPRGAWLDTATVSLPGDGHVNTGLLSFKSPTYTFIRTFIPDKSWIFTTVISARCNIYISRLCYTMSVSVTEVHWRIIANLGFKFQSTFTAHCGQRCMVREIHIMLNMWMIFW